MKQYNAVVWQTIFWVFISACQPFGKHFTLIKIRKRYSIDSNGGFTSMIKKNETKLLFFEIRLVPNESNIGIIHKGFKAIPLGTAF